MNRWEQRRRDYYLHAGDWEYTLRALEHWELYHRRVGDYGWALLGVYPTMEMAQAAV